ncbi:hypothetical protein MRS44_009162 [Fusarium solani]|uniref:uncharacterized protein n=1 Tax=Fusarium solani TaxID=169388 RepID=UPI0032C3ECC4|nr:hypothetical protein MRS44_009162 [Fusarium solani]
MPPAPGTIETYAYWYDNDGSLPCDMMPWAWDISMEDFMKWNPSITESCENFQEGYSYCVEAKPAPVSSTTSPPTTVHSTTSTTLVIPQTTPTNTATTTNPGNGVETPDLGEGCAAIAAKHDTYVCLSIIGHDATPTKPSTLTNGIKTPSPIQSGMVNNCNKFHLVKTTTTCLSIQDYYKLPLSDFYKWNPAIGSACTSLWANYYVCLGV